MSYLKSSYNLCVLDLPKEFKIAQGEAYDLLKARKFVDLTPSQDFGHGWTAIHSIFKTDFTMEDSVAAGYVIGGYRYDQKIVPKPLIKKLYLERKAEREKELGCKLEKAEKLVLKEECKSQMIMKALPNPKILTWILDLENNKVYLDTKSDKILEKFITLFSETFETDLTFKNYGLIADEMIKFLEWIWKSANKLETTWLEQSLTLDVDKNTFKFAGPDMGNYMKEIESIKPGKNIKNLGIGTALGKSDYSVTFSNKNLIVSVANKVKIKHESVETAIIDVADSIINVSDKIQKMVNQYLSE